LRPRNKTFDAIVFEAALFDNNWATTWEITAPFVA
jgi:hypothetical protein